MVKRGKSKKSKDKYEKLNTILIENFVSIQKALVHTTTKLEELSEEISKLLQLFEISAKSFAQKVDEKVNEVDKDREFLDKLNALMEQNKLIAKGLTLMEGNMRERLYGQPSPQPLPPQRNPIQYKPQPNSPLSQGFAQSYSSEEKTKTQSEI